MGAGDYFALLAYIEMNEAYEQVLQAMRVAVLDARRVAGGLATLHRALTAAFKARSRRPMTVDR